MVIIYLGLCQFGKKIDLGQICDWASENCISAQITRVQKKVCFSSLGMINKFGKLYMILHEF